MSSDKHFVRHPISLTCGDYACKNCLINSTTTLHCKICKKNIRKESLTIEEESKVAKRLITDNLDNLIFIIEKQATSSLNTLKGIFYN